MTLTPAAPRRATLVGLLVALVAFFVYWLSDRAYDAGRGDLFYLADAFLHGHTWIDVALGPLDVIRRNGHVYVPFGPFPAIALMPLVAITGPVTADQLEPGINAALAAAVVGLAWWVAGRIGVDRLRDRLALVVLLGFSTQIWWVTTRGGVWHTGHLVATILTLLLIAELFGRRRPLWMGLLIGADFLTRAPVAFATPIVALWLVADWDAVMGRGRSLGQRIRPCRGGDGSRSPQGSCRPSCSSPGTTRAVRFAAGVRVRARRRPGLPAEAPRPGPVLAGARPHERGLPVPAPAQAHRRVPVLPARRLGDVSADHQPGLLLAARAPWRDRRSWLLLGAAVLVLIPTLLYYGGGWFQYGYRYFLDSIPFVWALVALGIIHRGPIRWWGWLLIGWGVLVGLGGVYWAYHIG